MNYKDYTKDLPGRCQEILAESEKCKIYKKYDVTILLSLTATSFLIPYERTKKNHPLEDTSECELSIDSKISKSNLFNLSNSSSWKMLNIDGEIKDEYFDKNNSEYHSIKGKNNSELLSIIRNALAHGNIKTNNGKKIKTLYFVSRMPNRQCEEEIFLKKSRIETFEECKAMLKEIRKCEETPKGYKILQCSVEDFHGFFLEWIKFLNTKL